MTRRSEIESLPKSELHVHLEGTVEYATLLELAEQNNVELEAPTFLNGFSIAAPSPEQLLAYSCGGFTGSFYDFICLYLKISSCIRSADDLALIARRYAERAVIDGIIAAEIYVTPSTLLALGLPEDSLVQGLMLAERELALRGIKPSWIFDIVRNSPLGGELTVDLATSFRERGVAVSTIGLAGLEAGHGAQRFESAFQIARERGFKIYAHAGETAGPESIWETLQFIKPERIGHGVTALQDKKLLAELKARDILIEVCPWSNIQLGVCSTEHPIAEMYESGLNLVVASDDPGIFAKGLVDNLLLCEDLGLKAENLIR